MPCTHVIIILVVSILGELVIHSMQYTVCTIYFWQCITRFKYTLAYVVVFLNYYEQSNASRAAITNLCYPKYSINKVLRRECIRLFIHLLHIYILFVFGFFIPIYYTYSNHYTALHYTCTRYNNLCITAGCYVLRG